MYVPDIGCGCVIDSCIGSMPTFHREREVRARKEHVCCECGEIIHPGEMYEDVIGVWDGRFETYKTCWLCYRIRREYCCCWTYGCLREDLWEVLGVDYVSGRVDDDEL
jgi:hypothetical protein